MSYLKIIIIFSIVTSSNAFFARLITDPIESCKKEEDPLGLEKFNCIENLQTNVRLKELDNLSGSLQDSVVQNYEDINAASIISSKIVSQTNQTLKNYKRIKSDLKADKTSSKEQEISDGINLLANLEYKIQLIDMSSRCVGRSNTPENSRKLKACRDRKNEKLAPLLMNKALLISANPLLGNKHISEIISKRIDGINTNYNKQRRAIQNCHRNNRRSSKGKVCDDADEVLKKKRNEVLSFNREQYLPGLKKAIDSSIDSSMKLNKRHSEIKNKIRRFNSIDRSVEDMEELRDELYHNRDIATDYYVSAAFTKDSAINEASRCRLIAEYNANERNSLINSIALDLAVLAIPMGGPLLMARAVSRVSKLSKGLQKFFTAKKIATTAKVGTIRYELTAMGFDIKNLYNEKDHCEEVISKAEALGQISSELNDSYESCKSTLNNMTMSLVAASMGGAMGTFSLGKFLPKHLQTKNVLKLKSESKLSSDQISELSALKDGNRFPLIGKADLETLSLTPKNATLEVEVKTMFSSEKKVFTVDEFQDFAKSNELDSIKIVKINHNREFSKKELELANSKMTANSLERLEETPNEKLSFVVEYQSGELGSYSGNSAMIRELALRDDIKSINHSFSIPRSVESGHRVPASSRDSSFKLIENTFSKVGSDSKYSISKGAAGDLEDLNLYHGTIKEMEASVRGGPKNVGKGFGGRGLYLDVSSDARIAKEYSMHAQAAAQNRLGNISDNAAEVVKNADTTPVVMTGKLNLGKKDLKVGKFTIVRSGEVDLEKGILPANWDEDPRLVKMMEEKFHILDLRGMKSNGLNLDTDRILIIHENAGKNIVKWKDGVD
ncbi:hypothetical protein [Halobacteriovorax sp. HLS]|uniref:hypothetical protein n=1 Tax=Halobacteriovorax sp. HLS TaxID=2234000 RepID=UPI000FD8C71F|nr:hypothetical protein [Halobacteriovorax sp. HLS]